MQIRAYRPPDEDAVVELWQACGLTRPWNDPRRDIARKLTEQPELFLVGEVDGAVVSSAMVGFDGHRGWVYYLAVSPRYQGRSLGRMLKREAERMLIERGCPKLNLLVRSSNAQAIGFYRRLGYAQDDVVSLGRRLIHDDGTPQGLAPDAYPRRTDPVNDRLEEKAMANPFVHVELNTTDPEGARAFYARLFDWKMQDVPMPGGTYTMIDVGEGTGGGLMKHPIPGAPSEWLAYVLVDDVAEATRKAQSLGATVKKEVTEVPQMGWFSIIADPTGAVLGLWQARTMAG